MSTLRIVKADLDQACHRTAVLDLTRSYGPSEAGVEAMLFRQKKL